MAKPGPKNREMTPPESIESAQDRGKALRVWLNVQEISVSDFAAISGISRSALNYYFKGTTDIADATSVTADKLLRAMGISDTAAWEILGIPEDKQKSFRSTRPWPLGHAPHKKGPKSYAILLEKPLFGSLTLPAGGTLILDQRKSNKLTHQIYRLVDGRLFAVEQDSSLQLDAEWLGGLSSVKFEEHQ